MFWPLTERSSEAQPDFGRVPWFTITIMCVLTAAFVWSRIGLGASEQRIAEKKEALMCYFLTHDYTRIPPKSRDLFPKQVLIHARRTEKAVQAFLTDQVVQRKAQELLGNGVSGTDELRDSMRVRPKGRTCLAHAIRRRQLFRSPRERVYVSMARLYQENSRKYQAEQDALVAHIRAVQQAEQDHPLYGWGLRPAVNGAVTIATAWLIQPNFFSLLWLLLLIWPLGKMMEDQWRYPMWGMWLIGAGLLGNTALFFALASSKQVILGTHGAFTGLLAIWTIVYGSENVCFALWVPGQAEKKVFAFQGYFFIVVWFVLEMLDTLLIQGASPVVFLVHVLLFGALAGGTYLLQQSRLLEVALGEPVAPTEQEIAQQTWRTDAQIKQLQEQHRQKQLKRAEAFERNGRHVDAGEIYKELMQMGQPSLELLETYLAVMEKAETPGSPEEYLQAIRLALFEQKFTRMKNLYLRFRDAHDLRELSAREHVTLATDLKRAGLLLEAAEEADTIMEKGQDTPMFMKALIIRAESLLEYGEDPEAAMRLFYQAKNFLPQYPEFDEVVSKGMQAAQVAIDAEQIGPPVLPATELEAVVASTGGTSAGMNAVGGTSAGLNTINATSGGMNTLRMQGLPRSAAKGAVPVAGTPIPKGPPGATPIPQGPPGATPKGPPGAVPGNPDEILPPDYVQPPPGLDGEEGLFGHSFEDPYKELKEAPASGASWEEIPSLLLARASEYAGKSGFVDEEGQLNEAAEALKEKVENLKRADEAWLESDAPAKSATPKVFFGGAAAEPNLSPPPSGVSLGGKPPAPMGAIPSPIPAAASPAPMAPPASPAPSVSVLADEDWGDDWGDGPSSTLKAAPPPEVASEKTDVFRLDSFSLDDLDAAGLKTPEAPPSPAPALEQATPAFSLGLSESTPPQAKPLTPPLAKPSAPPQVDVMQGEVLEGAVLQGEVLQEGRGSLADSSKGWLGAGEVLMGVAVKQQLPEMIPLPPEAPVTPGRSIENIGLGGGSGSDDSALFGDLESELQEVQRQTQESASSDELFSVLGTSADAAEPPVLMGGILEGELLPPDNPPPLALSFQKAPPAKEGESLFARLRQEQSEKGEKK
ncbi:MAG: hypothetical protein H6727_06880 [Myxococcales bacterium]|nr:hypothetical protein [Myxococcales bacterium]